MASFSKPNQGWNSLLSSEIFGKTFLVFHQSTDLMKDVHNIYNAILYQGSPTCGLVAPLTWALVVPFTTLLMWVSSQVVKAPFAQATDVRTRAQACTCTCPYHKTTPYFPSPPTPDCQPGKVEEVCSIR